MVDTVKQSYSCTSFNNEKGPSVEYMMVIENVLRAQYLTDNMKQELLELHKNQNVVSVITKIQSEMNLLTEANGQLNLETFQKMISGIKSDLDEKMAKELSDLTSRLKNNPKLQDEIDKLPEKYKDSFDLLDNTLKEGNDIGKGAKFLNNEQRMRFMDNQILKHKNMDKENDVRMQKISRKNAAAHEAYLSANKMLQTFHTMFMNIIKNWRS